MAGCWEAALSVNGAEMACCSPSGGPQLCPGASGPLVPPPPPAGCEGESRGSVLSFKGLPDVGRLRGGFPVCPHRGPGGRGPPPGGPGSPPLLVLVFL